MAPLTAGPHWRLTAPSPAISRSRAVGGHGDITCVVDGHGDITCVVDGHGDITCVVDNHGALIMMSDERYDKVKRFDKASGRCALLCRVYLAGGTRTLCGQSITYI